MAIPLLSTLREPPVRGQFYLVPVIIDHSPDFRGAWPVLGPMHTDVDLFPNFPWPHYHIDFRFVTIQQERRLSRYSPIYTALGAVGALPLSHRPDAKSPLPKGLPQLMKRKCRRPAYGYAFSDKDHVGELERQYGVPCKAITRPDGRKLCPHRKVDLSSFPPRPDGTVVCPLHGLTVQIAEPA